MRERSDWQPGTVSQASLLCLAVSDRTLSPGSEFVAVAEPPQEFCRKLSGKRCVEKLIYVSRTYEHFTSVVSNI
jgi:hypothetical protein